MFLLLVSLRHEEQLELIFCCANTAVKFRPRFREAVIKLNICHLWLKVKGSLMEMNSRCHQAQRRCAFLPVPHPPRNHSAVKHWENQARKLNSPTTCLSSYSSTSEFACQKQESLTAVICRRYARTLEDLCLARKHWLKNKKFISFWPFHFLRHSVSWGILLLERDWADDSSERMTFRDDKEVCAGWVGQLTCPQLATLLYGRGGIIFCQIHFVCSSQTTDMWFGIMKLIWSFYGHYFERTQHQLRDLYYFAGKVRQDAKQLSKLLKQRRDRQAGRQTGRQTDRQTDRERERERERERKRERKKETNKQKKEIENWWEKTILQCFLPILSPWRKLQKFQQFCSLIESWQVSSVVVTSSLHNKHRSD